MTTDAVFVAYLTVLVAKVVSLVWAATQLPDRVASHFGGSGAADGWMENRPELRRRLATDMQAVAALIGALLITLDVALVQANRSAEPSLGTGFLVVSGAFVITVMAWALLIGPRRYAVPDGSRPTR